MKAATIVAFGAADRIEVADIPRPEMQSDEILVRVRAAAVNPKDTFIRKGRFKMLTGRRFPMLTGFDFAGEVADAGGRAKPLPIGTPVYGMLDGWRGGACAEYVAVKQHQLDRKPESLSFEEAAALPLAASTALQALRDQAGIRPGCELFINGASGGVGSAAVQIARILGALVTAASSAHNHSFLLDLGAARCIDYRKEDISQSGRRFDIFFDVFGNRRFAAVKPILNAGGTWVSTVVQPHVFRSIVATKFFSRKKAKLVAVKSRCEDLSQLRSWVDAGTLKPVIHDVYPLDRIREAHVQQETKHTRGKLVIRMD
jgi:NADPH:quinone reductase-like Zn-dependent oxidoreductase